MVRITTYKAMHYALCTMSYTLHTFCLSMKEVISLIAKGFCMGTADIVPGVSGGTMAFILGIYERLVDAIHTIGKPAFWKQVLRGQIVAAIKSVPWGFLIPLGCGILLAIFSLSHLLEGLLHSHPAYLWSFFFGLVLASIHLVYQRITTKNGSTIGSLLLGTSFAYLIVGIVPTQTPEAAWFLVLSGAIASCAMILPGISGSFILVILGKYEFVLNAVNQRELSTIALIGVGAVAGLLLFSDLLHFLLRKYHDLTIAFLTGLMIGSLRKIWPWKVEDVNVLPDTWTSDVWFSIVLMVIGAFVVLTLERAGRE